MNTFILKKYITLKSILDPRSVEISTCPASIYKHSKRIINPLLPNGNIFSILLIFFFCKKVSSKNFSYERRAYESIENKSLSYALSQNMTRKRFQAVMG